MVALPLPELPGEIADLRILALDLRWTWSHEHDAFWERIDPRLWRRTRNPWSVLQSASARRLQNLAADAAFRQQLADLMASRQAYIDRPGCVISAALDVQDAASTALRNHAVPGGALTAEGSIPEDIAARLKADFEKNFTGPNRARVMIAGDGLKYERFGFTPEDAEMLESRRFSAEEVA
jgi:hypothetical protein